MTRVAVIGGGVAGLVAARRLALAGVAVTVFEGSDRLGGLIQPARLGPLTIDIGAEAFAVRGGAVERLLVDLGLEDALVEPRTLGSGAYGSAGAYRLPAGGMLGIPAGADAPGLFEAIGAEGVAAVAAEAELDASVGADEESFAALVRTRFGERVLRRLVAPVARGVYSLDPELIEHQVLIPTLAQRLAEHGSLTAAVASLRPKASPGALVRGVRGGMHRFVAALVAECERLGVEIRLQSPMRVDLESGALVPFEANSSGRASDRLADAAGEASSVEREPFSCVLVSTGAAISGVPGPAGSLGIDEPAATVSSEVFALLVDAPKLDAHPRGTGVLVSDADDVAAKALTHVSAKWPWLAKETAPGQHVIRLSYGPAAPDADAVSLALDDDQLAEQALRDASRILDIPLERSQLRASARQPWRMPMPAARIGRTAALSRIRAAIDTAALLEACGTWIDGTGLANVVPGAESAAERILARLDR
ncbi:MAG: protoporphyrinogen oxidase [Gulosibacter sp.]|uniref:protoporphyrinogen oxidase n=1 Tax=Gulosibacter sp. TaxID=2817531 RepID=UPI003F909EDA